MPEAFGQKEARRMQGSIAGDPKALDWSEHVRRVSQDSAAWAPKVPYPPAVGGLRTLVDKVGGSR
jgi:hypothetical protein